jgi:hypothetical protein
MQEKYARIIGINIFDRVTLDVGGGTGWWCIEHHHLNQGLEPVSCSGSVTVPNYESIRNIASTVDIKGITETSTDQEIDEYLDMYDGLTKEEEDLLHWDDLCYYNTHSTIMIREYGRHNILTEKPCECKDFVHENGRAR